MKMNSNTHAECMHKIVTNLLYFIMIEKIFSLLITVRTLAARVMAKKRFFNIRDENNNNF